MVFFFTFAKGFPPHVTVRYPLLKRIVTFCGCKIWNVLFLNKKRNFSDLNDWPKLRTNERFDREEKSYKSLTNWCP